MSEPTWHSTVSWHHAIPGEPDAPTNPVFRWDSACPEMPAGWYYCDENWALSFGPFETETEANESLKVYAEGVSEDGACEHGQPLNEDCGRCRRMSEPTWHDEVSETVVTPYAPPDPVYQTTGGWYYCDEVWASSFGPFETEEAARASLKDYSVAIFSGFDPTWVRETRASVASMFEQWKPDAIQILEFKGLSVSELVQLFSDLVGSSHKKGRAVLFLNDKLIVTDEHKVPGIAAKMSFRDPKQQRLVKAAAAFCKGEKLSSVERSLLKRNGVIDASGVFDYNAYSLASMAGGIVR